MIKPGTTFLYQLNLTDIPDNFCFSCFYAWKKKARDTVLKIANPGTEFCWFNCCKDIYTATYKIKC